MNIDSYTYTNPGKYDINEDSLIARSGLFAVADGLGGCDYGEEASARAVGYLAENFSGAAAEEIAALLRGTNEAVFRLGNGARTTIAAGFADGNSFSCANVGDSRVYYFRNGKIFAVTKDHSVCQASVDAGMMSADEIRMSDDRSKLLKVLGETEELKLGRPYEPIGMQNGDAFLICSDGFWDYVYETEMEIDLAKADCAKQWARNMLRRHIRRSRLDCDNFTIICGIIQIENAFPVTGEPSAASNAPVKKKRGASPVIIAAAAIAAIAAAAVIGFLIRDLIEPKPPAPQEIIDETDENDTEENGIEDTEVTSSEDGEDTDTSPADEGGEDTAAVPETDESGEDTTAPPETSDSSEDTTAPPEADESSEDTTAPPEDDESGEDTTAPPEADESGDDTTAPTKTEESTSEETTSQTDRGAIAAQRPAPGKSSETSSPDAPTSGTDDSTTPVSIWSPGPGTANCVIPV